MEHILLNGSWLTCKKRARRTKTTNDFDSLEMSVAHSFDRPDARTKIKCLEWMNSAPWGEMWFFFLFLSSLTPPTQNHRLRIRSGPQTDSFFHRWENRSRPVWVTCPRSPSWLELELIQGLQIDFPPLFYFIWWTLIYEFWVSSLLKYLFFHRHHLSKGFGYQTTVFRERKITTCQLHRAAN